MSNHTDMQDKYCGHCYDIHPIQSQYKGNHKRGGAAEGRAPSFVVCFVFALNGASILALSTIYDLRLSKTGRTVVGRTFDWMDSRSDAVSRLSGSFLKGTLAGNKANGQSPYDKDILDLLRARLHPSDSTQAQQIAMM